MTFIFFIKDEPTSSYFFIGDITESDTKITVFFEFMGDF